MPHAICYKQLPSPGVGFFEFCLGPYFTLCPNHDFQQMWEVLILDMFTDPPCAAWLPGFRELLMQNVTQWEMASAEIEFIAKPVAFLIQIFPFFLLTSNILKSESIKQKTCGVPRLRRVLWVQVWVLLSLYFPTFRASWLKPEPLRYVRCEVLT